MIYLENNFIKASFSPEGAELQSLINKHNGTNYLWSGNKDFWGKFSPVLFPIVGGLKDNTYYFEDVPYHLSRHGFARDSKFTTSKMSESEVIFSLTETAGTMKNYPFKFNLEVSYKLEKNVLKCNYCVENTSDRTNMFFSIGGHPAFSVDVNEQVDYSDYYLKFNADEELIYHKIYNDLISDEIDKIKLDGRKLPLAYELFYNDALVFKSLKSNQISLRNNKNSNQLDFNFEDFPYFGIWAAKNANFICLEPWCGIADTESHNQNLISKEGIRSLGPTEKFTRTWSVSLT
ncbi:MAG: aldose 1-epimerase family protein [Bacteroidota bacterium]